MQCKKCGQENLTGTAICQKCGSPFGASGRRPGAIPLLFQNRLIGALAIIAAAVAIAGFFLPWARAVWSSGQPPADLTAAASGWDLVTGNGDAQDSAEPYAIMAMAGGVVLALGALWAFLDPKSKSGWTAVLLGGALAIAGCAWAWQVVSDVTFVGAVDPAIETGTGISLMLGGGIGGILLSVAGRLGATESRIRI